MNEIVIEDFGSPEGVVSLLTVKPKDPLTGTVTIKNNKLSTGTDINVGFIFGTYDEDTKIFMPYLFKTDVGNIHAGGSFRTIKAPDKRKTKNAEVKTYAPDLSIGTTFDIMAFVGPWAVDTTPIKIGFKPVDWGFGPRVIGINWANLQAYYSHYVYDTVIYLDQVMIKP